MDNNFLEDILGKDGANAIQRAVERVPLLKSVVIPRSVVSWISIIGKIGYDGELPGTPNSYFSLIKNENDNFDGALTIDDQLYTFENTDLLHVAASVGVSLGIDVDPIDENLKTKDLTKLGKSIDLLVKSQIIKNAQKSGIKMSQHGEFHVEHTGAPVNPYVVKHSASNKEMLGRIGNLNQAKTIANWYHSKSQKISKKEPPESNKTPGPPNPPTESNKPEAPVSPQKQPGKTSKMDSPVQIEENLTAGQGRSDSTLTKIRITKSESEKFCQECGTKQFKDLKFVGCFCLNSLFKSVDTEEIDDGFLLKFKKSELDEDAISTIISSLKD